MPGNVCAPFESFDEVLLEGAGDLVRLEKPQAFKGALAEQGLGPPPKGRVRSG